jgi:hypothetical protein
MNIVKSTARYENRLREQLKGDLVKKELTKKHDKMAKDAFQFLRATYWRWAETILDVCPDLRDAPQVLAVGDIHVENFGTWRDAEGRLVWGMNDFDEAARMPYVIDIVRLAASAVLAEVDGISQAKIYRYILAGYREGLADPRPIVLDREYKSLRKRFVVSNGQRKDFRKKFDPDQIKNKRPDEVSPLAAAKVPPRFRAALDSARPDKGVALRYFKRTAGTGSLGRRRIFGSGEWQGDLVVREAKAIVASGWVLAHDGSHGLRCEEIAFGKHRSPDPTYRLRGNVLVRRLSPNDFKIETKQVKGRAKVDENPRAVARRELVYAEVLHAMGRDLAAIHAATNGAGKRIARDVKRRRAGWLAAAVRAAGRAVRKDFRDWRAYHGKPR